MTDQHVACELCAPPEPATPAASVARPRVLVIDDEAAIRSALGRALAAEGLVTDLAETAADGLSRARADVYDLVILDLLMPGTDGFAVLRQLLRDRPGQTVLVLSCLADVRHKVDCFDLGARDYLTKPFSLDELLARARNQLRGFDRVIRAGQITLHVGWMEADIGHGPPPLTRLEFLVLKDLMEHVGQALSKGQLLVGVGLRLRPRLQHRQRVRQPAPVEDRRSPDQDRPQRGVPACGRLRSGGPNGPGSRQHATGSTRSG